MENDQFTTPEQAEAAFYRAFADADLEAMMAVWAADEPIVCVHPMGPLLNGRRAVEESWRRIFSGGSAMRFRISDARCSRDDFYSVHSLRENIEYGPGLKQQGEVIATNVYKRTDQGWRMILHHASPGVERRTEKVPEQTFH